VVLVAAAILGVGCGLVATSLRGVIGSPASVRGYSQQAELIGSATVKGQFGASVALSAGGGTALAGAIGHDENAGAGYLFAPRQRRLAG
jgi:hypothetical protein